MLLVHKSRRTSSRVFQPLSFFASPFVGSWYERFSTNDKRNYFFSWNNIWSWPLCYCFSLIAGHNKTGLFFCLLKLTCDCCEELSHCCSIDSALGSVKRWLQRYFFYFVSICCFAPYVPEPRKVATVATISMNYSWDWFLIFVSLPSPFWTFLVSVLI
jgi:hypothetical protein